MRSHSDMVGNPRHRGFGLYLLVNTLTMLVMPVLQLIVLACLPFAFVTGRHPFSASTLSVLGWLGLALSIAVVCFSIGLNRAWRDLRFLWSLVLWPLYSTGLAAVAATALCKELSGQPANWHKMQRTGVVSVGVGRPTASAGRHRR